MSQTIVVLEGDQTGQELLVEALRVLQPSVIGFDLHFQHFDLSLANRRATQNQVVHAAAAAIRQHRLGLKAATITPEGMGDVGSPNAILRDTARARELFAEAIRSDSSFAPAYYAMAANGMNAP